MNRCVDLLARREEPAYRYGHQGPLVTYPPQGFGAALPDTRAARGEYVWTIIRPDVADPERAGR